MTTKIINGTYAAGFYVTSPITTLSITATGYVEGAGVYTPDGAAGAYTIVNDGRVKGSSRGVYLSNGGAVTNGSASDTSASITGTKAGVDIAAAKGVVANFGTISGAAGTAGVGVYLTAGGSLTNGSASDTKALVQGADGVLVLSKTGTITNFGTIDGKGASTAQAGVYLAFGGCLTNGSAADAAALVEGRDIAVRVKGAAGTVVNFGTILGVQVGTTSSVGVYLNDGGSVTNGSTKDTGALIEGSIAVAATTAAGTVNNYGTLTGLGGTITVGVYLQQGGVVNNGAVGDPTALIQGSAGVVASKASSIIRNFGTIDGDGTSSIPAGVYLKAGGVVINGGGGDTTALIEGTFGAAITNAIGTIINDGSIVGNSGTQAAGAILGGGGEVINGSATDTKALIQGGFGVAAQTKAATVLNFATIVGDGTGANQAGVALTAGGSVINGGAADTAARIQGEIIAVLVGGASGTVANFGTLVGVPGAAKISAGAYLEVGGRVTNGSATDTTALIQGVLAVVTTGKAGTVVNFGSIIGGSAAKAFGVELKSGGSLVNGASGDTGALIEGNYAVGLAGTGTVTNFGTIKSLGAGGDAVLFTSPGEILIVETGSRFIGAVKGDGGTLDLASGTGIITDLTGGNVTVRASMPLTTFTNFGTVEVAAGAHFTLTGSGTMGAGGTATLNLAGVLAVTGALTTAGKVVGAGTLALEGGTTAFDAGTSLDVAHVTVSGSGTQVGVATKLTYSGVWSQSGGTLTVASGESLTFVGSGDSLSGTIAGGGVVAFTGGSDTLKSVALTASGFAFKNANVTLEGAIDLSTTLTATTPNLIVAASGVSLSGGGKVILTNAATNRLYGAGASATLTNVDDVIQGAGQLGAGKMVLINGALGIINGDDSTALTINTGSATIANAGLIENTGAGGTIIQSAVKNTGILAAAGGTLTVDGAVTGTGSVHINGGTADFASTFSQNAVFGPTGVLELGHSQSYGGTITGFSKTGANSLDLGDIVFHAGTTKATYSGTKASGVLTVTDGVHTATAGPRSSIHRCRRPAGRRANSRPPWPPSPPPP
jgi:hypothetical protein